VDDVRIASVELKVGTPGKFFDEEYPIPAELIKDKNKIAVRCRQLTAKLPVGCLAAELPGSKFITQSEANSQQIFDGRVTSLSHF